jgi:hypothetical protein
MVFFILFVFLVNVMPDSLKLVNMKRVFGEINIFKNILDMFTFPKN